MGKDTNIGMVIEVVSIKPPGEPLTIKQKNGKGEEFETDGTDQEYFWCRVIEAGGKDRPAGTLFPHLSDPGKNSGYKLVFDPAKACPRCEQNERYENDYLCETCRYG